MTKSFSSWHYLRIQYVKLFLLCLAHSEYIVNVSHYYEYLPQNTLLYVSLRVLVWGRGHNKTNVHILQCA